MTRKPNHPIHGPEPSRFGRWLTRMAIVVLSLIGLIFAAHGVYRVMTLTGSTNTSSPDASQPSTPSAPPTREKVPLPAESRMPGASSDGERETPIQPPSTNVNPAPPKPAVEMAETPPADHSSNTKTSAVGWSAEPHPTSVVEESPHPFSNIKVKRFLVDWKTAWENTAGPNQQMDTYISFYASDFRARGMDLSAWKKDKQKKNRKKRWIKIDLSEVTIREVDNENHAEVTFIQDYQSSNYSSTAPKTLILRWEASGLKIIRVDE